MTCLRNTVNNTTAKLNSINCAESFMERENQFNGVSPILRSEARSQKPEVEISGQRSDKRNAAGQILILLSIFDFSHSVLTSDIRHLNR